MADEVAQYTLGPDAEGQDTWLASLCRVANVDQPPERLAIPLGQAQVAHFHGGVLAASWAGLVPEDEDGSVNEVAQTRGLGRMKDGQDFVILKPVPFPIGPRRSPRPLQAAERIARQPGYRGRMASKGAQLRGMVGDGVVRPLASTPLSLSHCLGQEPCCVLDRQVGERCHATDTPSPPSVEHQRFVEVLLPCAPTATRDDETLLDCALQPRHRPVLALTQRREHRRSDLREWLEPAGASPSAQSSTGRAIGQGRAVNLGTTPRIVLDRLPISARPLGVEAKQWDGAVAQAIAGMSPVGAQERRRHAIAFANWCHAHRLEPTGANRNEVARYIATAAGRDLGKAAKIRCSLRAVAAAVDLVRSSRVFGLGQQVAIFDGLPDTIVRLLDATAGQRPDRRAVRLSALRRLLCWAHEVDAAPESLSAVDLPQFRTWLLELGIRPGETLVVARDFVELRWSKEGRSLFADPPVLPTRIRLQPPLKRRFG
jgi:hypothetical protein